jgi:hypothetical protein
MRISRELRNEIFGKVKELSTDSRLTFETIRLVDGFVDGYNRINFMFKLSSTSPVDESIIVSYEDGLNELLSKYNLICSFHNGHSLYEVKNIIHNQIKYISFIVRVYIKEL